MQFRPLAPPREACDYRKMADAATEDAVAQPEVAADVSMQDAAAPEVTEAPEAAETASLQSRISEPPSLQSRITEPPNGEPGAALDFEGLFAEAQAANEGVNGDESGNEVANELAPANGTAQADAASSPVVGGPSGRTALPDQASVIGKELGTVQDKGDADAPGQKRNKIYIGGLPTTCRVSDLKSCFGEVRRPLRRALG